MSQESTPEERTFGLSETEFVEKIGPELEKLEAAGYHFGGFDKRWDGGALVFDMYTKGGRITKMAFVRYDKATGKVKVERATGL